MLYTLILVPAIELINKLRGFLIQKFDFWEGLHDKKLSHSDLWGVRCHGQLPVLHNASYEHHYLKLSQSGA